MLETREVFVKEALSDINYSRKQMYVIFHQLFKAYRSLFKYVKLLYRL